MYTHIRTHARAHVSGRGYHVRILDRRPSIVNVKAARNDRDGAIGDEKAAVDCLTAAHRDRARRQTEQDDDIVSGDLHSGGGQMHRGSKGES